MGPLNFDMEALNDQPKKRRGFTDGDKFWSEEYLWKHAKDLEVKNIEVESLLDLGIKWTIKTIFDVCIHIAKVEKADLKWPIIFNAQGQLMDGYHRVCKAYRQGHRTIPCVRFTEDPPPERIIKGAENNVNR